MTGPEFAASHGNDFSTWTTTDIESYEVFADIDQLPTPAALHKLVGGTTGPGKTTTQHAA